MANFIEMEWEDDEKVNAALIDGFLGNIRRMLEEIGDAILLEATENLRLNQSWVTGQLAKSGQVYWDGAEQQVVVLFGAPYAAAVEYGSRPHIAPLGPSLPVIQEGGKVKVQGTPSSKENPLDYWAWRKGKRKVIKTKYGWHTALGYGAWIKIMAIGASPHPYLRPAVDKVKNFFGFFAAKYGLKGGEK